MLAGTAVRPRRCDANFICFPFLRRTGTGSAAHAATMFAHHVFVADGGTVSSNPAQRRTAGRPCSGEGGAAGYRGQARGSFPLPAKRKGGWLRSSLPICLVAAAPTVRPHLARPPERRPSGFALNFPAVQRAQEARTNERIRIARSQAGAYQGVPAGSAMAVPLQLGSDGACSRTHRGVLRPVGRTGQDVCWGCLPELIRACALAARTAPASVLMS